jgi:hypothetical protein
MFNVLPENFKDHQKLVNARRGIVGTLLEIGDVRLETERPRLETFSVRLAV